jgi:hypothetical protein
MKDDEEQYVAKILEGGNRGILEVIIPALAKDHKKSAKLVGNSTGTQDKHIQDISLYSVATTPNVTSAPCNIFWLYLYKFTFFQCWHT